MYGRGWTRRDAIAVVAWRDAPNRRAEYSAVGILRCRGAILSSSHSPTGPKRCGSASLRPRRAVAAPAPGRARVAGPRLAPDHHDHATGGILRTSTTNLSVPHFKSIQQQQRLITHLCSDRKLTWPEAKPHTP